MTNQLWASPNKPEVNVGSARHLPIHSEDALASPEMQMCTQELALDDLPNDLTRMLFLASLRDCNSGRYLHLQLTQRMGVEPRIEHLPSADFPEVAQYSCIWIRSPTGGVHSLYEGR